MTSHTLAKNCAQAVDFQRFATAAFRALWLLEDRET